MATILQSPFVIEIILPFVLVFSIVFAVLQKSKVLGDGKKQVDSLVALVIGLIVVAFGNAVDIIVQISAFLAVAIVIVTVLLILIGAVSKEGEFDELFKKFKGWVGGVLVLAVVGAVLFVTGAWDYIVDLYNQTDESNLLVNVVTVLIIAAVVFFVMKGGGKGSSSDKK